FFSVTGQRLIAGRLLRADDDERPNAEQVVVVNKALVDRDFKGQNAVGHRFYTGDTTFATIVGVVSDIKNVGPFRPAAPEMYWDYRQGAFSSSSSPLMIRAHGDDPPAIVSAVR